VARKLLKQYELDMKECYTLSLDDYKKRSTWIRFKESVARLISPIL